MKRTFDEEIKDLKRDLADMAKLAENAIYLSIEALKNRDKNLAMDVIKEDTKIDEYELKIDEKTIDLLALRQPMAIDLRFLTTAIKINNEIERIADIAVNIAQRVLAIADYPALKPLIDIPKLAEIAQNMLRDVIESFICGDEELARKVILQDPQANKYRNLIYDELVNDYIIKDATTANRAIPLILIARHLERICDHATYIAEDVIYMLKAKNIRHHRDLLNIT